MLYVDRGSVSSIPAWASHAGAEDNQERDPSSRGCGRAIRGFQTVLIHHRPPMGGRKQYRAETDRPMWLPLRLGGAPSISAAIASTGFCAARIGVCTDTAPIPRGAHRGDGAPSCSPSWHLLALAPMHSSIEELFTLLIANTLYMCCRRLPHQSGDGTERIAPAIRRQSGPDISTPVRKRTCKGCGDPVP